MIAFSVSEITRLLRSGPATIRSSASWNSGVEMTFLLRRADRIAASFTRFARAAPEKPGDWGGAPSASTPLFGGLPLLGGRGVPGPALLSGRGGEDLRVEGAGGPGRGAGEGGPGVAGA